MPVAAIDKRQSNKDHQLSTTGQIEPARATAARTGWGGGRAPHRPGRGHHGGGRAQERGGPAAGVVAEGERKPAMKIAALYLRKSSEDERSGVDGKSIDRQLDSTLE